MKRVKLLGMMIVLMGLLTISVYMGSSYAPVIESAPEDIETIWEIEDTRQESERPLVTALENAGIPLAYDVENNTFYGTLGLGLGEAWPEIHLTAPKASHVHLLFADDYTFDDCEEAIREGRAYQVMAYTDDEYAYFDVVFTGLPILCIETDGQEIVADVDTEVRVCMTAYHETILDGEARAHLRGASTLLFEKKSMRLEFVRPKNGATKKIKVDVPGFGNADSMAMLPCINDDTKMRDRLSWMIWNRLTADEEPFGGRKTSYAEVFMDGEYRGVYVLVEPVNLQTELSLAGDQHVQKDSVYRTAALNFARDRAYYTHPLRENAGYELYATPQGSKSEAWFDALLPYVELMQTEDDELFTELAAKRIDTASALRQMLFVQGCGLADNVFNNMYIWARMESDGIRYSFAPWDLDQSWGYEPESIGWEFENWLFFPIVDRMLNLNVGEIRQQAYEMWQDMRRNVFNETVLEECLVQLENEVAGSGALERDAYRWDRESATADGEEFRTFAQVRWPLIDEAMEMLMETEGPVDYLSRTEYGRKGYAVYADMDEEE